MQSSGFFQNYSYPRCIATGHTMCHVSRVTRHAAHLVNVLVSPHQLPDDRHRVLRLEAAQLPVHRVAEGGALHTTGQRDTCEATRGTLLTWKPVPRTSMLATMKFLWLARKVSQPTAHLLLTVWVPGPP